MILKLKPFSGRSLTSSDAESVALLYAPTMLPVQRKEDVRCPMGWSPYPMGPEAQPIGLLYPTHESTQVKKALKAAKVQR